MTLAACEWIFGARPLAEIGRVLARAGYDALEITGEPERDDLAELARLELRISGCTSNCDRPERDLAHPDGDLRRQAVRYYLGCVDLVASLGARAIGLVPTAEGRLGPLTSYEREWALAVEGAREVALYAAERGVGVAVEPLNRYEAYLLNRVDQALAFADELGVPGVGITADLFHMNIEEADPAAALASARGRILELHLADSNRRGLGRGHLPLERLLPRDFDGALVVEVTGDELDADVAESAAFVDRFYSRARPT